MSRVSFCVFHVVRSSPFQIDFYFGKWEKSQGAMSGEYGGCCTCGISCLAKKCCASWAECAGALSWLIFQSPDDNFSGRLRRIESRRRRRPCNNIPCLLFDPLQRSHDTQHRLDRDNCERHLRLASNLASLSPDVRPSLKRRNHSENLSTTRGILSESRFNNIICFIASFS